MAIKTKTEKINSVYHVEISNADRTGLETSDKHVYLYQTEKGKGKDEKVKLVKEWTFEKTPQTDVVLALADAHIKYLKERKKVNELKKK